MRYYTLLLLFIIASFNANGQSIDDEVGFIYTKAQYLIETNRTEDAVEELNKIIKKDASFKDALLLRAESKYQLGAYTGVRKDLARFIELKGITPRVSRLYGLTDFQSGKTEAALNSLTSALSTIKDDKKMYEVRAQIYESENQLLKACEDYKAAGELGSNVGKRKSKSLCGDIVEDKPKRKRRTQIEAYPDKTKVINKDEKQEEEVVEKEEESSEEENNEVMDDEEEEEMEEEGGDENAIYEIIIDEDLTLIISGEGLGAREIVDKPNILILSDDSGDVAINICVSRAGRVTSAEFDNINSTIKKQSLVSLALRKSKDFWFEKNGTKEQCGKIIFKIKGI